MVHNFWQTVYSAILFDLNNGILSSIDNVWRENIFGSKNSFFNLYYASSFQNSN